MPSKRRCKAKTLKGKPCQANPLKKGTVIDGTTVSGNWCRQHDKDLPDSSRIGGAQPGAGRPPSPRAVDVLRERIEQEIDQVLDPLWDALGAEAGFTVGWGEHAFLEMLPDHKTRIAAVRELLDRGYGRPKQATEITTPDGGALILVAPADATEKSAKAAALLAGRGQLDAAA
jgi:hypothetical protein